MKTVWVTPNTPPPEIRVLLQFVTPSEGRRTKAASLASLEKKIYFLAKQAKLFLILYII